MSDEIKNVNEENEEYETDVISLVDEDGNEEEFEFVGRIEYNDAAYVALVPVKNNNDGEYVLLKLIVDENGEESLITIDDDDEFEAVSDKFEDELFEDIDYDDCED